LARKQITAKIDKKTGKITMETSGFTGAECVEATKEIELALGKVESQEKTPEYYKKPDDKEAWIKKMG